MSGVVPGLPAPAAEGVTELLGEGVKEATPVPGGDINENVRIRTASGRSVFLKFNADAPEGFFRAEADGLELLKAAGAVDPEDPTKRALRVPQVLGLGEGEGGAWLLLEFVEQGEPDREYWSRLGRGLAAVHDSRTGPERPNFIGPLPQSVAPRERWPEFWIGDRLAPQLERARAQGRIYGSDDRAWDGLLDVLPRVLPRTEAEGLGLLHGDLWSGNVFPDRSGLPVLVDPAVYLGDGRVDLAMAELFGGFSTTFFQAYEKLRPVGRVYEEFLRDAYQLYPLLVHVNLFGASYVSGLMGRVRRILAALGA